MTIGSRWIRRGLWTLLVLALLLALAVWGALQMGQRKMDRRIEIAAYPLAIPVGDGAAIERGRYLYHSRGCADCHGAHGGGAVFIDDPDAGMLLAGPNITTGGVTAAYQGADWDRILRHGVKPNGRPAFIMPSEDFNRLTDADLAAIAAYVQQLPPVAQASEVFRKPLPLAVRVLYGLGQITDAAAKIDHSLAPAQPVPEGITVEHGRYVAESCKGCHGVGFSGGRIPGTPPSWPAAANLTPGEGTAMQAYAQAEAFVAAMRSGKRPDGSAISPVMPFAAIAQMSDTDLRALHLFLRQVPAKAAGGR